MSGVVVTLGGVSFQDMEVPERIAFGGRQRLAVQPLIGGGRVVQALGIDDGLISFAGIFSGDDAVSRAQWLDAARAAGAVLPLVWDEFFYSVIIRDFAAEYRKTNLIPFAVTCAVVADPLADVAAAAAPLAAVVAQDVTAAAALSGQAGVAVGNVAGSMPGLMALQAAVAAQVAASGAAAISAGGALQAASDPAAGVSAVNAVGAASSQLAAASGMSGFVARAANNLGMALV